MLRHIGTRFLAPVGSCNHMVISSAVTTQSRWFHEPVVGAPTCGDIMWYQNKVGNESGKVNNAVSAIAFSSIASEWAKGKQIEGLLTVKNRGHFRNTLPQARHTTSHQLFHANIENKNTVYFYSTSQEDKPQEDEPENEKSQGDKKASKDIDVYGEGMRRRFYVNLLVEKIISKALLQRMWRRTKAEWYRLLRTRRGSRLLLRPRFLRDLDTSMEEEDMERSKKLGSGKVCLGRSFSEHVKIKRNLYHFKHFFLSKRRKEEKLNLPARSKNPFVSKAGLYNNSIYTAVYPFTRKQRIRKIELPTHYMEVNYKTLKAVVTYGPNSSHLPSKIKGLL